MKMKNLPLIALMFTFVTTLFAQGETVRKRHNYQFEKGSSLTLEVEIDAAEVTFAANDRETELSVYLAYEEDRFEYDIDYDEKDHAIFISFDKTHWMDDDDFDGDVEIEIMLPAAVIVDLDCRVKAGEVNMDLGDLSLQRFELKTWAGEVEVDFHESNRIPMRWLGINTKVGETRLIKLGNARFQRAEINSGIGQLNVDFTGIDEESSADIDLDIGATEIYIPDNIGVKLNVNEFLFLSQVDVPRRLNKKGKYYYSDNYDQAKTSVLLKIKPGIGELRIAYH